MWNLILILAVPQESQLRSDVFKISAREARGALGQRIKIDIRSQMLVSGMERRELTHLPLRSGSATVI